MQHFIQKLDILRQEMPDPFRISDEINKFYSSPTALVLIKEKKKTVESILDFLGNSPAPPLVVPAVLLLSYFDPDNFYTELINILKKSDAKIVQAFEHGFWHIKKSQDELVSDLIKIAYKNPNALLLLQRPIAMKFKKELQDFITDSSMPLSLYAMYCYKYVLEKKDIAFMKKILQESSNPEIVDMAKNYSLLLK